MEISSLSLPPVVDRLVKKTLLVMKLTTLLILLGCLHLSAAVLGQNINLSERNVSLETIFNKLEKQSGYTFFYNLDLIRQSDNVTVNVSNGTLTDALEQCFKGLPLHYSFVDNTVVITRKPTITISKMDPIVFIGKISDERGNPLPGVTVKIKNSNIGVVTNAQGQFTILVPDRSIGILQFTFIGYLTQELSASSAVNPLNIVMKENISTLDEVQILAYGQTTKRLNTGNVTTISAKEIGMNPVPNVLQALAGRVPGLFIQQNSGLPNSSFQVQIRGNSSVNATNPLYVVDGVTYPGSDRMNFLSDGDLGNGSITGGNALNFINPSEIESVTVLKDADATAIYGARGGNGVILITTKKGKAGIPQLNINARSGISVRGTAPKLLNTEQYLALRREALKNDGVAPKASDLDINGAWPEDRDINWQKLATGSHASNSDVNVAYSGGSGTTNYRISGQFGNQTSIQLGGGSVKNIGLRFDLNNTSPNKKFYFDMSGGFSSYINDTKPGDLSNVDYSSRAPNAPDLLLPDGQLNWDNGTGENLLQRVKLLYKSTTNNLLSNTILRYTPVKGLTINATIGYSMIMNRDFRAQPTDYYQPIGNVAIQTVGARSEFTLRTWTIDPNINYVTKLGKKGTLDVRAGGTLVDKYNPYSSITGISFIGDALLYNPSSATTVITSYTQTPNRNLGYFGIIKYNWADKYLLTLNGRYDGSTQFGPGKQFGTFGSIGAAWIFTEEPWLKNKIPGLSFGKVRASYGITGNDGIGNYQYLSTFATTLPYEGKPGLTPARLANPNLQWETTKKREVELNLEFFKGRISLNGVYYNNLTYNQLIASILSSVTGFTTYPLNSPALISTRGLELNISTRNIESKDFTWSSSVILSVPKSKLVSYPGLNTASINSNYIIGKPISTIKLYNYAGVDPETGNYTYINAKGEKGVFTPFLSPTQLDQVKDKTQLIDLAPKYFGGFSNSFRYKNFNLDFFFEFKNRIGKNFLGAQSQIAGVFNANTTDDWLRRWQKPGDKTDMPRVSQAGAAILGQSNFKMSNGAYEKATYARLANLNFSYTLPGNLLKKANINRMSIFVQAQNLLTISKYGGGLDPENLIPGALPPLRIITGGINLTL
jgi:TonB-linked SusC/RagA family outer membrane protein